MSETTVPKLELGRVGEIVPRADGIPKVTGEFAYSSDLSAVGMLWGHTLRSPHAHARIVSIDVSAALTMPGVHAVLTHEDVPGEKRYGLEFPDQPVLTSDRVRYFTTSDAAAVAVANVIGPGDTVLVKGSRGVKTERVVERLKAEQG